MISLPKVKCVGLKYDILETIDNLLNEGKGSVNFWFYVPRSNEVYQSCYLKPS
jgi:hypothetical protein